MPIAPETQSRPRPLLANDDYLGRCVGFADLGTHHNKEYNKDQRLIRFEFEIPGEPIPATEGGEEQPRIHQIDFNFIMLGTGADNQGKFWPWIQKWLGVAELSDDERRAFNPAEQVGQGGRVELEQYKSRRTDQLSNVIGSVKPLKSGQDTPDVATEFRSFDWDTVPPEATPDEVAALIEPFPKWTKEKIMESEEYERRKGNR